MKTALITGINGMDGSHLADFLLEKGYKVYGVERRASNRNRVNTEHLVDKITFLQGDLLDQNSLLRCLKESNPDEIYETFQMSKKTFKMTIGALYKKRTIVIEQAGIKLA